MMYSVRALFLTLLFLLGGRILLLIRPKPYPDESLESYFLRLGQANGFNKHGHFIGALNRYFDEQRLSIPIILPFELRSINPCFANKNSRSRLKCLQLVSQMAGLEPLPILSLAIYRAGREMSSGLKSVIRQGKLYPKMFLKQSDIGICPECLVEAVYIRQLWHFEPYRYCHIHNVPLIHICSCGQLIDYLDNSLINKCPNCGIHYADLEPIGQNIVYDEILINRWLAEETVESLPNVNLSHRWGLFLWWHRVRDEFPQKLSFLQLMKQWPKNFNEVLHKKLEDAKKYSIHSADEIRFSDIFGDLLFTASRLPSSQLIDNLVMHQIHLFLHTELIRPNNLLRNARINALEASVLLGSNVEQIAALVEQGELNTCIRLKSGSTLQPSQKIFKLGDIFLLWLARFQIEGSNYHVMTSIW